jgi:DNA repair protein RecO (recombination protein O)
MTMGDRHDAFGLSAGAQLRLPVPADRSRPAGHRMMAPPSSEALVLTLLPHGEHGAVVRFLARDAGLVVGFVPGARSRRRRADLAPGNRVALSMRVRTPGTLPTATVEPIQSRALLAFEPDTAAALDYLVHLPAILLPEQDAHPALFCALDALLSRLAEPGWQAELARFELLLLKELGFGLDLGTCALSGATSDLVGVSPKSGRAVSRAAASGQRWAAGLLPLPPVLTDPGAQPARLNQAFALTGHFLARDLFPQNPALLALRERALDLALARPQALSPPP